MATSHLNGSATPASIKQGHQLKILLLSDLHTEFQNNDFPAPHTNAEIIILAGDIAVQSSQLKALSLS